MSRPFEMRVVPNEPELEIKREKPVVLFAAIVAPTFSPDGMRKGFEQLGFHVEQFNWQAIKFECGVDGMCDRLIGKANMVQPDLIFLHLQNPDTIDVDTAKALQEIAPTVNYTFDIRHDISWYKEIGRHIEFTYFGSMEDVNECKAEGINNVGIMQSSCDYDIYKPIGQRIECPEIIFIGNNYVGTNLDFPLAQHRQDMIAFLKEKYGDRFGSYGLRQEHDRFINVHEEVLLINSTKVVISQNNFDREQYTSDRLWRILACGKMPIIHKTKGIEDVTKKLLPFCMWDNFDRLIEVIDRQILMDNLDDLLSSSFNYMYSWRNRFEPLKLLLHENSY